MSTPLAADERAALGIQPPPQRHHGSNLDERVVAMAKALDLDANQQSELRHVLEQQRAQIVKVWSETTIPAVNRVGATQAIGEQTADRIRALLDDEQKRKYSAPRQPRAAASRVGERSVEDWMDASRRALPKSVER